MRRAVLAAAVLALAALGVSSTSATWTSTVGNSSSLTAKATFLPVVSTSPALPSNASLLGTTSITVTAGSYERSNITITETYKFKVCIPVLGCVVDQSSFQASPTLSVGATMIAGTTITVTVRATNAYGNTDTALSTTL